MDLETMEHGGDHKESEAEDEQDSSGGGKKAVGKGSTTDPVTNVDCGCTRRQLRVDGRSVLQLCTLGHMARWCLEKGKAKARKGGRKEDHKGREKGQFGKGWWWNQTGKEEGKGLQNMSECDE